MSDAGEWYTGAQVRCLALAHVTGVLPELRPPVAVGLVRLGCVEAAQVAAWKLTRKGELVAKWATNRLLALAYTRGTACSYCARGKGTCHAHQVLAAVRLRAPSPRCGVCGCTRARPCVLRWEGNVGQCVPAGVFGPWCSGCTMKHGDPLGPRGHEAPAPLAAPRGRGA